MNEKLAYIETIGCQMNERDSEIMGQMLEQADYKKTGQIELADLILINTCSIRAKAEQKFYSLLGRLRKWKQKKPALLIAAAGCVAQQEGAKIPARMPHVDIVLGTQHIYQLPDLVKQAASDHRAEIHYLTEYILGNYPGVEARGKAVSAVNSANPPA
jgi:tRNA-2-methylthio-N6-dimethylallyladenosine synthase